MCSISDMNLWTCFISEREKKKKQTEMFELNLTQINRQTQFTNVYRF